MTVASPTLQQSIACSIGLLLLALVSFPLTALFTLVAYLVARARGTLLNSAPSNDSRRAEKKGMVLVNGGRMVKALVVSRALARAGYKVVLVEEEGWGDLCAPRFSSSISVFRLLPSTSTPQGRSAYVDALVRVAREEGCVAFVPCSGAGSTVEDARAAEMMRKECGDGFRAVVGGEELTKMLHEKDSFLALVKSLSLLAPSSKNVTSIASALDVIRASPYPLILKCDAALDDTGRSDLTTYPLEGDDKALTKTTRRLEGLRTPISKDCPYALQQFVANGTEWCTHASVVDGRLVAFVCCPSNDMLMTYVDASSTAIGRRCEAYTLDLISRLAASPAHARFLPLTGSFSLDFILSSDEQDLYVIECNPRVHTASCLLPSADFARALMNPSIDASTPILRPRPGTPSRSWLAHDLPARLFSSLLPSSLHPLLEAAPSPQSKGPSPQDEIHWWRDPTFAWDDPVPFLALVGLQAPAWLIKQLWKGKGWSRINVSTGRVFEC